MLNVILPLLQGHPKVKAVIEQTFGQPVDHVTGCFGAFLENVKKGPGLVNTAEQKLSLFNHIYHGGLSLGFADWESEFAAAKIAGYTDLDICRSFRERHNWPQTRIEDMPAIEANVMPRFIPKARAAGLLSPDMFPESGLPKTNVTTTGGAAPWEPMLRSGAGAAEGDNNAPKQ